MTAVWNEKKKNTPEGNADATGVTRKSRIEGLLAVSAVVGGIVLAKKVFFSGEEKSPPPMPESTSSKNEKSTHSR